MSQSTLNMFFSAHYKLHWHTVTDWRSQETAGRPVPFYLPLPVLWLSWQGQTDSTATCCFPLYVYTHDDSAMTNNQSNVYIIFYFSITWLMTAFQMVLLWEKSVALYRYCPETLSSQYSECNTAHVKRYSSRENLPVMKQWKWHSGVSHWTDTVTSLSCTVERVDCRVSKQHPPSLRNESTAELSKILYVKISSLQKIQVV